MNRTEHERNLIATLLRDDQQFTYIRPQLKAEYFSNPLFAKTFTRMAEMAERGLPVDVLTVTNSGSFDDREKSELWDIRGDMKAGGHAMLLFQHVLNGYLSRESAKFIRSVDLESFDAFDYVQYAAAHVAKIENTLTSHTVMSKTRMLDEYQTYLDDSSKGGTMRIPTPWSVLTDALNGGIGAGDYVIIGGTPGSGKTSAMLALGLHAAMLGHKVAFITGEMTRNELLERIEGIHTGFDISEEIRRGKNPEDHKAFMVMFSSLPFDIISNFDNSADSLRRSIGIALNDGASLVIIDYLQKFAPTTKKDDEHVIIKNVSGWLRNIPLKENIGLVVASSINREGQSTHDALSLGSLYGSSMLGHDCTTAIMLSNETGTQKDMAEMETGHRKLTLHIVKNRSGIRGKVNLDFQLRCQRMVQVTTNAAAFPNVLSMKRGAEL